ncbi:MAG TPA: hypothetical protein VME40_16160 [Caulobacteraceae bacterium]|nr:hypothetical protein [Caulobacteraceae bacterium]
MLSHAIATALVLSALGVQGAPAAARTQQRQLQSYLDRVFDTPRVIFRSAEADLRGDGKTEVVVYVTGPDLCGTGGCDTLVLERTRYGFRTVMDASVTRLPIRLLRTHTHGWRDIGVMVAGGGITSGYEARLRFDGRRYPSNPTTPPAQPLRRVRGTIIIDDPRR